jgi:hypothetical protein
MASPRLQVVLDVEEPSRHRRPPVPNDVQDLIRTMSQANPLWGAPRIHGELLKVGIDVCQATVAKYMVRRVMGLIRLCGAVVRQNQIAGPG